jgi:hypothetical protein
LLYESAEFHHDEGEGGDDGENGDDLEDDLWRQILSHIDPVRRATLLSVDPEEREDVLMQLQTELIDAGVIFDMAQQGGDGDDEDEHDGNGEGNDEGRDESESGDDDEEDEEDGAQQHGTQQGGAQDGTQQDGAQDGAAQDNAAQEGGNNEPLNAEALHNVDPSLGDGEDMLNLDPNAHTARNLDQPNFDHLPLVPQEFAAIAVSSADSDAPSSMEFSQGTASNIDWSATSPEDLADSSDQEDSLSHSL